MEYTVACNWDKDLIDKIDYPQVNSVFAGLPNTLIAGGRSSKVITPMEEKDIKDYIQKVHNKGWEFNFNLNSTCLADKELTSRGYHEIIEYLEWISNLGVDSVTVSNTNLIGIIKKRFPNLKIKVSTYQKIDSVEKAKRFEDMGVDMIMLSEHVNRDFKLLKAIRKNVNCKLILIANVGCVFNCPNMHSHANSNAHNGAHGGEKTIFTETYHSYCFLKRIKKAEELIKIRWIRPEDVAYYEEIGIDMLKIIDRSSSTEALAERVQSYCEKNYEGNLLDFPGQMMDKKHTRPEVVDSMMSSIDDEHVNNAIRFLNVFSHSLSDLYYLDNKKIPEDFIQEFAKRDCARMSCETCGYCKEVAKQCVSIISEKRLNNTLQKLEGLRDEIMEGSILY